MQSLKGGLGRIGLAPAGLGGETRGQLAGGSVDGGLDFLFRYVDVQV